MNRYKEKAPSRLKVADALIQRMGYFVLPGFGVFTSSDESLSLLGREDGHYLDKPPNGIMKYPNQFAGEGGSRSAFCPIDHRAWEMRDVVKKNFGDRTVATHREPIQAVTTELLRALDTEFSDQLIVHPTEFARKMVIRTAEKVMFDFDLSDEEAAKVSAAYALFNNWCAKATMSKGFIDIGREPHKSYLSVITGQTDEGETTTNTGLVAGLSRLLFSDQQQDFNATLEYIAHHSIDLWNHMNENDQTICGDYLAKAEEHGMSEDEIILELTNIVGAAIASPASHLAFCLAVYARLDDDTKDRVRTDEEYRRSFYYEMQRLYQPLPWFMRDVVEPVEIDGKEMDSGTFVFFTYSYNRREDIWGADAAEFRPERFMEDPKLKSKLLFFGKGRRRCPGGKFGEAIARESFEALVEMYDVIAKGSLEYSLTEAIAPEGEIIFVKRSS